MGRRYILDETTGDLIEYKNNDEKRAAIAELDQRRMKRDYAAQINAEARTLAEQQNPVQNAAGGFLGEVGSLASGTQALLKDTPVIGPAVGLLPEFTPEQNRRIDILRQLPQYSPAAFGGQVAGSVPGSYVLGQAAKLPGRVLGKGATGQQVANALQHPAFVNTAAGGLYELLRQPSGTPVDDRLLSAGMGALAGGAISVPLTLGGAALRAKPSAYAQELMTKGVPLTWGEAAGPGFKSRLEHTFIGSLPFSGAKLRAGRLASGNAWDREMMKQVSPEPNAITTGGVEGFRQLDDAFTRGYDDIRSRTPEVVDATPVIAKMRAIEARVNGTPSNKESQNILPDGGYADIRPNAPMAPQTMKNNEAENLTQIINEFEANYQNGMPSHKLKEERQDFWLDGNKLIVDRKRTLGRAYHEISNLIDDLHQSVLSPEDRIELKRLDNLWKESIPIADAHVKSAATEQGYMTPQQLSQSIKTTTPKVQRRQYARGERPLQSEVTAAQGVYHHPIPAVGPGTAERLIGTGMGIGTAGGLGAAAFGAISPWMALAAPTVAAADWALSKNIGRFARPYEPGWMARNAPGVLAVPGVAGLDWLTGGGF